MISESINREAEEQELLTSSWNNENESNSNMNIGQSTRQTIANPATVSLVEAQNEAMAKSPLMGELKWRRMDPTLDAAVAPLLQKPIVPFHKTEKVKAQKSAIYYSECFLKGITPNDADRAAIHIGSQYQKWWIKSAYHEEEAAALSAPRTSAPSLKSDMSTDSSSKRKHVQVVSDASHYSNSEHASQRRRRGSLRDAIDDVAFDLQHVQQQQEGHHSRGYISAEAGNYPSRRRSATRIQPEEEEEHQGFSPFTIQVIPNLSSVNPHEIEGIRDEIIAKLKRNGGILEDPSLKTGLSILESYYLSSDLDARRADTDAFPYEIDGTWLTLSRPTYTECQGKNNSDEYLYSLGRMSFDMFRPTNLKCSIQGIFNTVQMLDASKGELPFSMPRKIRKELGKSLVDGGVKGLRTYNIVVALTIEPDQTRAGRPANGSRAEDVITRPIRGIMTNYGYLLPDPNVANRLSVWFTGGSFEVNDDEQDLEEWKKIFGEDAPNRDMGEFARVLAAKVLLGASISDKMEENGTLSYFLKRPIGGHGSAFCDIMYMDDKLRLMRGHNGSIFAFSKVQD
mmetsp:Transcript_21421/g.35454  ORF Transcript_21421/g.35454 Transcript_21421/m.35454 type:complete len:567 (+) Transcript_21421:150-1850(+)